MTLKIAKPKIAIFTDLHLGKHNNIREWHQVAIDWCDWFIKELHSKKIKDVIFCGDWHDNRSEISVHTLDVSAILIDKFHDFNLHMIVGNHDIPYKHGTDVNSISIYNKRPNIKIYTQLEYIEAFDKKICMAPWGSDLSIIDKCDIIFGHLEIQTFKMGPAKVCEKGWSAVDLLIKCNKIFSGHFHLRTEKTYNEGSIIYAGNPFQMEFGDTQNDKGYYILDLDTLDHTFVKNVISPTHHVIKLSSVDKLGLDAFKNKIIGNCLKLDVDIEYDTKKLFTLYDNIVQYKPFLFVTDYSYIAPDVELEADVSSALDGIDIKNTIGGYIDAIDIYGKEECKVYITELFEKCK